MAFRILGALLFALGFTQTWVGARATDRAYTVDLRITSPLPFAQIPVDPWIDFASLATEAGVEGVLDPNSIQDSGCGVGKSRASCPQPPLPSRPRGAGPVGGGGSGAERLSDPLSRYERQSGRSWNLVQTSP